MAGGIVLVFIVILAGAFIVLCLGAYLLFQRGKKSNSRTMTFFGGCSLVMLFLVGFSLLGVILIGSFRIINPKVIFDRSFGFKPTKDVVELKSSYWYFADTGMTYLKFKASPQTVKRIVDRGLIQTDQIYFRSLLNSGLAQSSPSWWAPTTGASVKFFYIERKPATRDQQDFASETEILSYDEKTSTVYYCFNGID